MTTAEATLRHSILYGMLIPPKISPDTAEMMVDEIYKAILDPAVIWAVRELAGGKQ